MTNPPYVTQGSGIYRKILSDLREARRNGLDLRDYYDGCGLGVESMFLRYISGALKPGGIAYVIVPLGLLNRTDPKPKASLLNECNLIASIQLPSNTFFNTSQKTYILVLQKRHTDADERPDVFCGVARSIGESLDWRRVPLPDDNDLGSIADSFVEHRSDRQILSRSAKLVKIVPAARFGADDRWDVLRFWSDKELVSLGEKETPMSKQDFIDQAELSLEEIKNELQAAKEELDKLQKGEMSIVLLNDEKRFRVRSGDRIKSESVRLNPGEIPVYSCFKNETLTKGCISEKWLRKKRIPIEIGPVVTVNANGASVGKVFFRNQRCVLTDDVIAVDSLDPSIDPEFLTIQLRNAVAMGGFSMKRNSSRVACAS
jgi:type I restriction enzyme M protein